MVTSIKILLPIEFFIQNDLESLINIALLSSK